MMNIRRIFALLLVVTLVFAAVMTPDSTAASEHINSFLCYIEPLGGGSVRIHFEVYGTGVMEEIGAGRIVLEKSADGESWTAAEVFHPIDHPQMLAKDASYHAGYVDFVGESGMTYRAELTAYASDGRSASSRSKASAVTESADADNTDTGSVDAEDADTNTEDADAECADRWAPVPLYQVELDYDIESTGEYDIFTLKLVDWPAEYRCIKCYESSWEIGESHIEYHYNEHDEYVPMLVTPAYCARCGYNGTSRWVQLDENGDLYHCERCELQLIEEGLIYGVIE